MCLLLAGDDSSSGDIADTLLEDAELGVT